MSSLSRVTVRNGTVRNFAGNCIRLGNQSRVADMFVSSCGEVGIVVESRSVVTGNSVESTGGAGLDIAPSSVFFHNTLSDNGLAGGEVPAQTGGMATAGNFCADGSCGNVDTRRRFYLTEGGYDGSQALGACDSGFHMASMWEILDVTQLSYDASRGVTQADSGEGPPAYMAGWIRTGMPSEDTVGLSGTTNCQAWTSSIKGSAGTQVYLYRSWPWGGEAVSDSRIPWWYPGGGNCAVPAQVWCVED